MLFFAWVLLIVLGVMLVSLKARVAHLEARLSLLEFRRERAVERERDEAVPVVAEPEPEPEPVVEAPEPMPIMAMAAPPGPEIQFEAVPEPARPARTLGFEDIFGRYLPIWAGGITLVVAGVLIVRYSIEAGLLSPLVRVIAGLVFGTGLIAASEVALRSERWVRDPRIAQSLAGAGLATLYASILVAANLYHLIAPLPAFVALAAVTVLAGGLSLRFGAPSAVLGLVGGLAAPALVGAEQPNVPLLAAYLAAIVGGLCALGRTQRWWWLGGLAIAGGFGWGLVLIVAGRASPADTLALGTFTLLIAVAFPLLLAGGQSRVLRVASALAGCAQMAALVATGGFAGLDWALFGLIAGATVWLSRREPMLADAPLASAVIGLLLAFAWPAPTAAMLAMVLGAGTLIHGVPAMLRLWRAGARLSDAAQIALAALAVALVPWFHFAAQASDAMFAALALLGAAIAGGAAALGWARPERKGDARFAMLALTAILLLLLAAGLVSDSAALAPEAAIAAVAALLLARAACDRRVEAGGQTFALLGLALLLPPSGAEELARAQGFVAVGDPLAGAARWLVPALAALAFAGWSSAEQVRRAAAGAAAALFYVAAAQLVPVQWLALIPAAMLAGLAWLPVRRELLFAPVAVAGAIALGWAAPTLFLWLGAGAQALVGVPANVSALPPLGDALARVGAPALALILLLHRELLPGRVRLQSGLIAAALAVIVAHVAWKQVFAIDDPAGFAALGFPERTLWEALLLGAALAASRLGRRWTALGLALAGLFHATWFTLLLHNPLWSGQAVGPWLLPAYAAIWTLVLLAARLAGVDGVRRAVTWTQVALILLFAASVLRQVFHGTWLSIGDVTQAEDIARSLVAILLAIGFLHWGIARADRDWRIASLLLMLAAVGKVFLFDAAGLDGLLRIGSFVALGVSLIFVGWLYSRTLPDARLTAPATGADSPQGEKH